MQKVSQNATCREQNLKVIGHRESSIRFNLAGTVSNSCAGFMTCVISYDCASVLICVYLHEYLLTGRCEYTPMPEEGINPWALKVQVFVGPQLDK